MTAHSSERDSVSPWTVVRSTWAGASLAVKEARAELLPLADHRFSTRSLHAADMNMPGVESEKSRRNMSVEWPVSVLSLSRLSRSQIVMVLLALARNLEVASTATAVTGPLDACHLLRTKSN